MRRLPLLLASLASLLVALLAWVSPIAAQVPQTQSSAQSQMQRPCGEDCDPPPPPPQNQPPTVTIVTPGTASGTRTPLILVRYEPGGSLPGDTVDVTTLSVSWGGTDVKALGRSNGRLFEWEVTPLYQLSQGTPKTLSVTVCSLASLCTTQTRTTTLPTGNAAILSVRPMPLEAAGGGSSLPFGPGFAVSGPEIAGSVSTPSYQSWDAPHSTGLTYSSRQSYPRALVIVDLEFPGGTPSTLTMKLWDGAVVVQQFTQNGPACSSGGQARCRVSLQADFLSSSSDPAVRKWLKVEAVATIGGTPYSTVDSVEVVLVDRRTTPYGSGWWPAGVARLVEGGSDAIIVASDGSATLYRGYQGVYVSPPGDRSTLVQTWSQYTGFTGWELQFRGGGKLTFDTDGRMTATEGPNPMYGTQVRTTVSYNTTDQVYRITDPAGKYFQFNYSGGKLTSIADPGSRSSQVTISNDQLTTFTPPTPTGHGFAQHFSYYQFTGSGVLANYWDQVGSSYGSTTIQYDASWRPYRATLPAVLDETGAPAQPVLTFYAQELKGLGATASLDTVQARLVDPRGNWSAWMQNRWGQTLRAWDAIGLSGINTYADDGLPLTSEGKTGDSTRTYRTYDALGRLVRTYRLRTGGSMLRLDSLVWNSSHQLIKRVDTFGNWTTYTYNAWGSVTSAISSVGDTALNQYDGNSRLSATRRSGASSWTVFYYGGSGTWGNTDSTVFLGPSLTTDVRNIYDSYGRLVEAWSKTSVRGASPAANEWRRRQFYYNVANQTDSVRLQRTGACAPPCNSPTWPSTSDPQLNRTTRHVYSYLGRDSVLRGPTGGVEEVRVYDALGRLVGRTVATSPAETFRYDVAGNLRIVVTRRGYQLETQYDTRNRVVRRLVPTVGDFTHTYGGPNDELTAVTADQGYAEPVPGSNPNLAWSYNQSGQLVSETTQDTRTTTYAYDSYYRTSSYTDAVGTWQVAFHAQRGTPDTLVTPFNDRVAYALDAVGRGTGPWITGSGNEFGRTQQWRASDGGLTELHNQFASPGYEAGRHLDTSLVDTVQARWTEQHGANDPLRLLSDSLTYDGWGRIARVDYRENGSSILSQPICYDAAGNMSLGGVSWTFSATGNRLLAHGGYFAYDNAGNLTSWNDEFLDLVTTYTYDALERLTGVSRDDGLVAAYAYDALGQRIAKSVNGVVTRFVWQGGQVVYETDGGGAIARSYTWGGGSDDLIAIHDHQGSGAHYYVVQDGLSSIRALVRPDGTWMAARRYTIHGAMLSSSGSVPFALRFRWAGAQYDQETGLYYLRSRYYNPTLGRFIQEDPIGHEGGMDLYGYADGNPTNARDPSGMEAEPMPESPSPWACLGTIRGCGDTSADGFYNGGGGGGGTWMAEVDAQWEQAWGGPHRPGEVYISDYGVRHGARMADINPALLIILEFVAQRMGVSLGISATMNGQHDDERHSSGWAVDINEISGRRIGTGRPADTAPGMMEQSYKVQAGLAHYAGVRGSYSLGPSGQFRAGAGPTTMSSVETWNDHCDHIHVSYPGVRFDGMVKPLRIRLAQYFFRR